MAIDSIVFVLYIVLLGLIELILFAKICTASHTERLPLGIYMALFFGVGSRMVSLVFPFIMPPLWVACGELATLSGAALWLVFSEFSRSAWRHPV